MDILYKCLSNCNHGEVNSNAMAKSHFLSVLECCIHKYKSTRCDRYYKLLFQVLTNYGEAYSANSGFFIAPVNGVYLFSAFFQASFHLIDFNPFYDNIFTAYNRLMV